MSTVVRSEVAGRSAGIDWRRGFDPIDRSISVDSRTIFSSLIQSLKAMSRMLLALFGFDPEKRKASAGRSQRREYRRPAPQMSDYRQP